MYLHHGLDHEYPRSSKPRVSYIVCATPRAGSSVLCDGLAQTELAGVPTEYFDGDVLASYWLKWGANSFEQFLDELRARKTSTNGVFGVQIHFPQFETCFAGRDVARDFPGLRWIHLRRRDRLRQAVSLFRAQSTDQWAWHHQARRPAPLFNGAAIRNCLDAIEAQERGWERCFAEHGVEPLRIDYEDFERDHGRGVLEALRFLDVEIPPGFAVPPPTLKRQSDDWSEHCIRGYQLIERYGPDLADAPIGVRESWHAELLQRRRAREQASIESSGSPDFEGFIDDAYEEGDGLHVSGWLLLDGGPSDAIEFEGESESVPASVRRRPDLESAFPAVNDVARAGFEAWLPRSSFAVDGAWRFTLSARGAVQSAFQCRFAERPGLLPTSFPRPLGVREVRFNARRDAAQAEVRRAASAAEPPRGEDALLGVSVDTTSVCNLRCTMCSLERDYPEKGVMSLETFRRLEDALPSLRHLSLSLNAEPLLNRHLVEMVAIAKRASQGRVATSFATNGTLLDERCATALIEAGLDALEISLDGTTREVFEAIRVGASFDLIVANIARIAVLKRRLGRSTPHVSLRFTLSRANFVDLPGLLDLALRLEIDHVVVNGLEPYDEVRAAQIMYGSRPDPEVEDAFERLAERGRAHGVRVDLPQLAPQEVVDCHLIDHACVVSWDGTVAPCSPLSYPRTFYFDGAPEQHPRLAFGNIRERPLAEIWRAPEYVDFRRRLRAGEVFDHCRKCLKRSGVICPLHHWQWLASPRKAAGAGALTGTARHPRSTSGPGSESARPPVAARRDSETRSVLHERRTA
jgi:LPS sulfotransferase NodH/MoaA/NifB/PqqE/SkfB family radical SAM enzyme